MSQPNHRDSYLEAKTLTAPSYRLHLILIEGALRYGRQAAEALRTGDDLGAAVSLMRVVDITGELLAGVRAQQSELNVRLSKLYFYLFHTASVAKINSDLEKLSDVLSLLEFERETWQAVCDRLSSDAIASPGNSALPRLPIDVSASSPAAGLSLQA